jgi:hypothetical protein
VNVHDVLNIGRLSPFWYILHIQAATPVRGSLVALGVLVRLRPERSKLRDLQGKSEIERRDEVSAYPGSQILSSKADRGSRAEGDRGIAAKMTSVSFPIGKMDSNLQGTKHTLLAMSGGVAEEVSSVGVVDDLGDYVGCNQQGVAEMKKNESYIRSLYLDGRK